MARSRPIASLAVAAALAACGGGGSDYDGTNPPPAPRDALRWPGPSYAQVQTIFSESCTSCHGTNGGLSLASPGSWANLIEVAAQSSAGVRVVPFDSASSVLHRRVTGDGLQQMPLGGPPLPAADIETIRSWIDEGGARQDLAVSLSGMDPHLGETVVLRLEDDSGELRTRAVLDPLTTAGFDLFLPRVRPTGSHVLAFWADHDGDGAYDPPPTDHAWSRSVPSSGIVSFSHDTVFTDVGPTAALEPGLDFTLDLAGMTPHVGQTLTVAVYKDSSTPADFELVGAYRLAEVPSEVFSIALPGIIDPLEDYWVDLHADLDGDGRYDAPPTDHAWRIFQSSTDAGLDVSFTHDTNFTDVSRYPVP
jgi:mono/diheme cytochrome c family protein